MRARFEHNGLNYEFDLPLIKRPEDNLVGPPLFTTFRDLGNRIDYDLDLAGIQENSMYYKVTKATAVTTAVE